MEFTQRKKCDFTQKYYFQVQFINYIYEKSPEKPILSWKKEEKKIHTFKRINIQAQLLFKTCTYFCEQ